MTFVFSRGDSNHFEVVAEYWGAEAALGLAVADYEAFEDFLGWDDAVDAARGPGFVDAAMFRDSGLWTQTIRASAWDYPFWCDVPNMVTCGHKKLRGPDQRSSRLFSSQERDSLLESSCTIFRQYELFHILWIKFHTFKPFHHFFEMRYKLFWVFSDLILIIKYVLLKLFPIFASFVDIFCLVPKIFSLQISILFRNNLCRKHGNIAEPNFAMWPAHYADMAVMVSHHIFPIIFLWQTSINEPFIKYFLCYFLFFAQVRHRIFIDNWFIDSASPLGIALDSVSIGRAVGACVRLEALRGDVPIVIYRSFF
jgi:hypothetical protein